MLCLSGFELYSRWVPLNIHRNIKIHLYIKGILDEQTAKEPGLLKRAALKRFYEKKKPNFHIKIT